MDTQKAQKAQKALAYYNECCKKFAHPDAVRFTAREFGVKPLKLCNLLGLDVSFLNRPSWV